MFALLFVMTVRWLELKLVMTGQETERDAIQHAMEMSLAGTVPEEALSHHQIVNQFAEMATELREKDAMMVQNWMELAAKLIAQDPCWDTTVREEVL